MPGSQEDAGVWQTTSLQEAIRNKKAGLPKEAKVASTLDILLPPVFVADDAFPIGGNKMKPFGRTSLMGDKRVFNYRLSRARRVVENACGISSSRFRCLLNMINAEPDRAKAIMDAACVLHNSAAKMWCVLGKETRTWYKNLPCLAFVHGMDARMRMGLPYEKKCVHFLMEGVQCRCSERARMWKFPAAECAATKAKSKLSSQLSELAVIA